MKKRRNYSSFLLVFIIILQIFCYNYSIFCVNISKVYAEKNTKSIEEKLTTAESMAVIESNSGRLLYSKDEHKKLPMASTTKIITAIVAIENCDDLDAKHQIPKQAIGIEGSSIYLRENEHLSVRELLYGLMLRSGNDSAVAIAIIVAGSVDNFVKLMNNFCEKLSLTNSHFVTVNGLHDDNHYTTAFDLAMATAYAMKNKVFAEIVSTKEKTISDENSKNGYRFLKNKNKLLKKIDGADGVKTGYTMKAGRCFVGSATRNKMQVICVVLNCGPMFEETANLIEKAFYEYSLCKLLSKGSLIDTEVKARGKVQKAPVILTKDIYYPLKKDEIKDITASLNLKKDLTAPISFEDEIGEVQIKLKNNLIFSQKLYTINIEENKGESLIKKFIKAF